MSNRKVFHDSVTPLPSQPGVSPHGLLVQAAKPEQKSESMTILFSLELPADAKTELEEKVAKGETVTAAELKAKYAPKAADVAALKTWLGANAYKDIEVSKDGTGVYATSSVDQIEKSLEVNMVRVTKDGSTYTAAQNAPSLPADVGAPVHAIIGLQTFRHAHKHRAVRGPRGRNRVGLGAAGPQAHATNVENAPPYLVSEIMKAYDADKLQVTGKGQTIGILIDTVPDAADVQTFWTKNGNKGAPQVQTVNVGGGELPPTEGEETLDVEWSGGIATGAVVRVYASGSLNFVDLDKALDRILADAQTDPTLRQVSISLGLGEKFFGGAGGEIQAQHQKFLQLAALGVNVFVSSGDSGSNPDGTGHGSSGPLQVEYEASDPCVIAVGGTSLTLDPSGKVASESAWSGSGGGKSGIFPRPAWQTGAGVPNGKKRLVPDVAAPADPETGALVVLQGKAQQIGGTSWAAPVWAGFCALINEARAKAGKSPLPFLNPLLYPLGGTNCFRDVVEGSNGAYDASPGYDMVTGLGTPSIANLIAALTK